MGVNNFVDGMDSLAFSILTINEYWSFGLMSLLIILPSLILFSAAYLLWEGHSLGWKLSISTCGIALSIAFADLATMYIALSIAFLSGVAATLEILKRRRMEHQTKDSPVVMENAVKLGLRLSVIFRQGLS